MQHEGILLELKEAAEAGKPILGTYLPKTEEFIIISLI
jgi:hypothetical protein